MKTCTIYLTIALLASCCPVKKSMEVDPIGKNASAVELRNKTDLPRPYKLTTCLVSGEDLDSMDERVSTVYQGQVFEFCCKPCLKKFNKDPEKYQAMLASGKSS
jgi:YHS domain-containing protein